MPGAVTQTLTATTPPGRGAQTAAAINNPSHEVYRAGKSLSHSDLLQDFFFFPLSFRRVRCTAADRYFDSIALIGVTGDEEVLVRLSFVGFQATVQTHPHVNCD